MVTALAVLVVLSQAGKDEHSATPVEAPKEAAKETPAPAPQPPPGVATVDPAPAAEAPRAPENMPSTGGAAPPTADLTEWWKKLRPFGYVKAGAFYTFPWTNEQLVGSNGGFRILTARIGIELNLVDALSVVASVELGAPQLRPDDPLSGNRIVEMRDAYLEYRVCKGFWVRAGQFKAPFNGETLLGDADLPFVTRSVATDGVSPPDAYGPRDGLTLGRQVGLLLTSDRLGGTIGFRYYLAGVNGNGQNQLFNDSNPIAPVGRVEVMFKDYVILGVNGFYNVRTEGVRPNRIDVNQIGYGADLAAKALWFRALVGFVGRANTYSGGVLPPDSALGVYAQLAALFDLGVEGAVRFGYHEPSTAQSDDQVWEFNALVGYRFKRVPLRVILQYTHRDEAPAVAIQNESVDAMVQVTW